MALDPNLAKVLTNIVKNHAQNVSNSNQSFRQISTANNSYVKNIVGQIHKAISYNNKKVSSTSSTINSTKNINNDTIKSTRDTVGLINNSTSIIYQMLNEIRSANSLTRQNNNTQSNFFTNLQNTAITLNRRASPILEIIGSVLTRGLLKGGGAKLLGGAIAATGLGAAATYAGGQIQEEYGRVKGAARESAEAPGPSEGPSTETPPGGARKAPSPSGPPSDTTPSPQSQQSAKPPSPDAKPSDTPNIIGGYTSTSQIPEHGGSKYSREFGFHKDTPQGRAPIRGGRGHAGLDIPIKPGQPYQAHMDGVVIKKGFDKTGYGHYVDVRLADGSIHRYSHLGTNDGKINPFGDIKEGQAFKKGDVLGYGGYSGNAGPDFPHVHNEVWRPRGKPGERGYQSAEQLYDRSNRAGGSRAGMQFRSDPRTYWQEEEKKEKERLEKEKQSKPDASQAPQGRPDANKPTSTDSDRIPNPDKPGPGLEESRKRPFGMVLTHMSGFTPGSPSPEGGKVENTTQELEFIKKGMYKDALTGKWKSKTGYGYHTAISSVYVNPATGERKDETEYNKLPEELKKQFVEQAGIHEIRPYSDRPYQAGALNPSAYGVVTVGKLTPAKIEAMKNHLAKMYADGLISKEALEKIYGHGELQKHGGRGHMQPGGEGAPMAEALRQSLDDILKRGEELKAKKQVPPTGVPPSSAPVKTDAIPQPQSQSEVPSTINTIAAQNEAQENKPVQSVVSQPTNNQSPGIGSSMLTQSAGPVDTACRWMPNITGENYTNQPKQQPSITV